MPQFDLLTDENDIEALAEPWRALHAAIGLAPFTDYDWAMTWWRLIGKPAGARLLVATCHDDGRLVGVIPFSIRKKMGVRVLRLLGHEVYYYRNFLVGTPQHMDPLWQTVLRTGSYDIANIKNIHDGTAEQAIFDRRGFKIDTTQVYYLDNFGATRTPLIDALPKRMRRKIRSVQDTIAKTPSMQVHICTGEPVALDVMDFLVHRKQRWAQQRGKRGIFNEKDPLAFYREMARLAGAKKQLLLCWMTIKDLIVAATFYVAEKGTLYGHTTAFDPVAAAHSPGIYLNAQAINWAAAQGFTEKNFMEGEDEYKARFTKTGRRIHEYMVVKTNKGQVFLWFYLILRQYRHIKARLANLCRV